MKTKRSGLTVIEILVVVGIIALLIGLLVPAVHTVQKMAKETKQKAQFSAIELGLTAFKNDYGDYPPSFWYDPSNAVSGTLRNYCGAQKLAEALLGWDLLGFHPDSAWRADGLDASATAGTVYADTSEEGLRTRKGRYIELQTANPFRLGGGTDSLFPTNYGDLAPRTYVLCDVFGVSDRRIRLSDTDSRTVTPGTPILYYRANPSKLRHLPAQQNQTSACIYDARDNVPLLNLGLMTDATKSHWLTPGYFDAAAPFDYFYEYIRDPRVTAADRPYRPDSYLLISAGMDGIYGTDDDIRNFGQ